MFKNRKGIKQKIFIPSLIILFFLGTIFVTNISLQSLVSYAQQTIQSIVLQPNEQLQVECNGLALESVSQTGTSVLLNCLDIENGSYTAEFWNILDGIVPPSIPSRPADVVRTDTEINFDWGKGSPANGINANKFIAKWSGSFELQPGVYNFKTRSDDGVRLYIDDVLVIDNWTKHAPTIDITEIELQEGVHKIVLEYFENLGGAVIQFTFDKTSDLPSNPPEEPGPIGGYDDDYEAWVPRPTAEQIVAGISECPTHNSTEWHGLYDSTRNCHYDHEHKHDPRQVDNIFGPVSQWWGGSQTISYPWETPHENEMKHNAYGWIVRRDIPSNGSDRWIKDFRIQYHGMSTPPGTLSRYHSFSLEMQICDNNGSCGIVRRGGWLDFGFLNLGEGPFIDQSAIPDNQKDCDLALTYLQNNGTQHPGRLRFHFPESQGIPEFFWYGSNSPVCEDAPTGIDLRIALATGDAQGYMDVNDPSKFNFICDDFKCEYNMSTIQAHVLELYTVSHRNDLNNDGKIDNMNVFANYFGEIDENCTDTGANCIPFVIEGNAPVGVVQHRDDTALGLEPKGAVDFDITINGQPSGWIKYPN